MDSENLLIRWLAVLHGELDSTSCQDAQKSSLNPSIGAPSVPLLMDAFLVRPDEWWRSIVAQAELLQ